jgi:hypothetical protein
MQQGADADQRHRQVMVAGAGVGQGRGELEVAEGLRRRERVGGVGEPGDRRGAGAGEAGAGDVAGQRRAVVAKLARAQQQRALLRVVKVAAAGSSRSTKWWTARAEGTSSATTPRWIHWTAGISHTSPSTQNCWVAGGAFGPGHAPGPPSGEHAGAAVAALGERLAEEAPLGRGEQAPGRRAGR